MYQDLVPLMISFPAALAVYTGREIFRNYLLHSLTGKRQNHPLYYLDIWAVGTAALFPLSWGGMVHRERMDNRLSYLLSQIFFALIVAALFVYFLLKGNHVAGYVYELLRYAMQLSYTLFLINFIPLPPFDASYLFVKLFPRNRAVRHLFTASKLALIAFAVFFADRLPGWLTGDFLIQ